MALSHRIVIQLQQATTEEQAETAQHQSLGDKFESLTRKDDDLFAAAESAIPAGMRTPPVSVMPELVTVRKNERAEVQIVYQPMNDAPLRPQFGQHVTVQPRGEIVMRYVRVAGLRSAAGGGAITAKGERKPPMRLLTASATSPAVAMMKAT